MAAPGSSLLDSLAESFYASDRCTRQAAPFLANSRGGRGLFEASRNQCWRDEVAAEGARCRAPPLAGHNALPWSLLPGDARGFTLDSSEATEEIFPPEAAFGLQPLEVGNATNGTTATPAPWTWPPSWTTASPSSCQLPCKLQHGCWCDHTLPHSDGLQTYGTCIYCTPPFGGWDCGNIVSKCLNGGNYTKGQGCTCPEGWTGTECGDIKCVHTVNSTTLNATTNMCPRCERGYSGIACDVCDDTIRCANGRMCNDTLVGAGKSLNMRCELQDEKLILALANNRPGCRGLVKMTCDKPSSWANTSAYDGTCHVSLWRVEPDTAFMDPFFYCTMSECAMALQQTWSPATYSKVPSEAKPIRYMCLGILYWCCVVLVILGVVPLPSVRRARGRLFLPTAALLVVVLLFYIFFATFFGHDETEPPQLQTRVDYNCKYATCNCAPAPANPLYYPSCNTSMAALFLRNVETDGHVSCDIATGECTFTQAQLPITFPIKCAAATCEPPADVAVTKAEKEVANATSYAVLGSIVGVVALAAAVHFYVSMSRSRRRAKEFRARFTNRGTSPTHALPAPPAGDSLYADGFQHHPPTRETSPTSPSHRPPLEASLLTQRPLEGGDVIRESETVLQIVVRSYKVTNDLPFTLRRKRDAATLRARRDQQLAADYEAGNISGEGATQAAALYNSLGRASDVQLHTSNYADESDLAGAIQAYRSRRSSRGVSPEAAPLVPTGSMGDPVVGDDHSVQHRDVTPTGSFASRGSTSSRAAAEQSQYKQILRDINLVARSGEAIAIIGSSGAGKTTLLDIIAQHEKDGWIDGHLRMNGRELDDSNRWCYKRSIGFVAQEDALLPSLTVRQTIRHAARLKLPAAIEDDVIDRKVEEMLKTLQLTLCADSVVGGGGNSSNRGISGGERRRVSIAMELIANPRLLLLDEPTSGLDSVNAHVVMKTVVDMAKADKSRDAYHRFFAYKPIVIFSIHQPSTDIFRLFDKLVVLSRGRVLYNGPADQAVAHTASILDMTEIVEREPHRNPAEVLLEMHHFATPRELQLLRSYPTPAPRPAASAAGSGSRSNAGPFPPAASPSGTVAVPVSPHTPGSDEPAPAAQRRVRYLDGTAMYERGDGTGEVIELVDVLRLAAEGYEYCPNVWEQFFVLCQRTSDSLMGSYYLIACHAASALVLGIVFSLLYQDEPLTLTGTEDKAGMITGMLLIVAFSCLSCLDLFMVEKRLFAAERANGYYSTVPYFISKVLFDYIPLRIVPVALLASAVYFPMGLRQDVGGPFLWFVAISVLFSCMVCGMCLAVGMVAPSFGAAALFSALLILWDATFGGLMINASTIPTGFRPFKFISPFYFAFEAMMINELDGLSCTIEPLNNAGVSDNEPIPMPCRQFLFYLGLEPKNFDRDVALLAAWVVGMLVIAGALLAFFVRHRR